MLRAIFGAMLALLLFAVVAEGKKNLFLLDLAKVFCWFLLLILMAFVLVLFLSFAFRFPVPIHQLLHPEEHPASESSLSSGAVVNPPASSGTTVPVSVSAAVPVAPSSPGCPKCNQDELEVAKLKDVCTTFWAAYESRAQPGSREILRTAPDIAGKLLDIDEGNLSVPFRVLRYEYAAYAYFFATGGVESAAKVDYARRARDAAKEALKLINWLQTVDGEERRRQRDDIERNQDEQRSRYFLALALAELHAAQADKVSGCDVYREYDQINKDYLAEWSPNGEPPDVIKRVPRRGCP